MIFDYSNCRAKTQKLGKKARGSYISYCFRIFSASLGLKNIIFMVVSYQISFKQKIPPFWVGVVVITSDFWGEMIPNLTFACFSDDGWWNPFAPIKIPKIHSKHFWKQALCPKKEAGSSSNHDFLRGCGCLFQAFPFTTAVALFKKSWLKPRQKSYGSMFFFSAGGNVPRSCDPTWWWGAKNGGLGVEFPERSKLMKVINWAKKGPWLL